MNVFRSSRAAVLLPLLLLSLDAAALQPLDQFLSSAATSNHDVREVREAELQKSAEATSAWGRLFPVLTARATITRNEEEISFFNPLAGETLVIQPETQRDEILLAEMPLVDLSAWARISAASAGKDALRARAELVSLDAERQVAEKYYQVIVAEGLVEVAARTLSSADEHARVTKSRLDAGAATLLDVDRAVAEVERAKQMAADADLVRAVSRRALRTLSGLEPALGADSPIDDLHDEAPLGEWIERISPESPVLRASAAERRALERAEWAAGAALLPFVSVSAMERFTNATGFSGKDNMWALTGTATWRLDMSVYGAWRAQAAQKRAAHIREEKTRVQIEDAVYGAWQRVHAQIAKARAARAQEATATRAVGIAEQLYASGASTQLDLIHARRDATGASAQRVQADADLAYARALLRIASGDSLSKESR